MIATARLNCFIFMIGGKYTISRSLQKENFDLGDKILIACCFALIAWLLVCTIFGIKIVIVRHNSMAPIYCDGDVILMRQFDAGEIPNRGDVVTFHPYEGNATLFLKRVIGLPGDELLAKDDVLTVNGQFVDAIPGTGDWIADVPDGYVFCLGDNRTISNDSRYIGCIAIDQLCTKIL